MLQQMYIQSGLIWWDNLKMRRMDFWGPFFAQPNDYLVLKEHLFTSHPLHFSALGCSHESKWHSLDTPNASLLLSWLCTFRAFLFSHFRWEEYEAYSAFLARFLFCSSEFCFFYFSIARFFFDISNFPSLYFLFTNIVNLL